VQFNPHLPCEVFGYWMQERRTLRQGFAALGISTGVGIGAGIVLGFMEELLHQLPGLLMLVPAAIGMRGAIFGAMAARLGTGILTGQFVPSWERRGFAVQNVRASAYLTLFSSALAAVAARAVAGAFGLDSISVWELMVISMVGGVLSSAVLLVMVLLLARTAQRRNWDMDAIGAPLVTTVGDIVTLPALVLATLLVTHEPFTTVFGVALFATATVAVAVAVRGSAPVSRRIVLESLPVLTYAAVVDVLAGGVLEARVESFVGNPALLVLIPPFIANCGSLGGILSARLGSELHLGLIRPRRVPEKLAAFEGSVAVLFSLVAFSGVGLIAHVASLVFGFESPGLWTMVGIALVGGLLAFGLLFAVAYYTASATYHFGLDPDNHGIPIVTATMDFFGVLCLVASIILLGAS
jgi:mgtE-like transporter